LTVMRLAEAESDFSLDELVFGPDGRLGGTAADTRMYQITVRQLLQHTAGFDRDLSGDPMFMYSQVSQSLGLDYVRTVTCSDIIEYELKHASLDYDPGTHYAYSNLGYCILGRVIEKVTGERYEEVVTKYLLEPSGVDASEMYIGNGLLEDMNPAEAEYACNDGASTISCDSNVRSSSVFAATATTPPFVPPTYGQWSLKTMDSHGGWVASPRQLLKVIRRTFPPHCATSGANACLLSAASRAELSAVNSEVYGDSPSSWYGLGFNVNTYDNLWHTGSLDGTTSLLGVMASGYSWSVVFNKRGFTGNYDSLMWDAVTCANDQWPAFTPVPAAEVKPPIPFDGWTPASSADGRVFTQVSGNGWCVDADGNEGRSRWFGQIVTAADCRAACAVDKSCVGYAGPSTATSAFSGGSCVVYSDTTDAAQYPGWSFIAGSPASDFKIESAAGSEDWKNAFCFRYQHS